MLVTGDCRSNSNILRPLAISESLPVECLQFLASSKLWLNCEHRCEEVEKFAKMAISRIDNKVVVVRGCQCSNLHVIDATKKLFYMKDLVGCFRDRVVACLAAWQNSVFTRNNEKLGVKLLFLS